MENIQKAYLMADFRQLNLTSFNCYLKRIQEVSKGTEEECGIITDCNFYHLKNIAKDKKHYFKIPYRAYFNILKKEPVKIIWHSHVKHSADPSDFDILTQVECDTPYLIYSKKDNNFCFLKDEVVFFFKV